MQDKFNEIAAIGQETTAQAVIARMMHYLKAQGFLRYALGQLPSPPDFMPDGFLFHNWPEGFTQTYEDLDLGRSDPTLAYAMSHAQPVRISALFRGEAGVPVTSDGRKLERLARKHGGGEGAVIPIFGQQGYRALAAFMRPEGAPDSASLAELRLLAITVHDRLVDLQGSFPPSAVPTGMSALTEREHAVLIVARSGKSDAEIAERLGISVRTVRFHFANARRKLGAPNRATALLAAANRHLI